MKLLTNEEIIQVIEGASDAQIRAAQLALPNRQKGFSADWLAYGVKEGLYEVCTVTREGTPVANLFFHVDRCRTLVVNASHSLLPTQDVSTCIELAARRLAAERNCLFVEFMTLRKGHILKALKCGYEICGVSMRRELNPSHA